ncbi:MAG: hypothetical protein EO766_11595 [Hydrotalea sp. AMD]|uniref:group I intron-associated PD-(D/E)XK endonuclease n=1 Tax=Hydrotalea sp. AMD TaxID=2501297 RepID=UPI0010287BBD|nr:group I intron-associated PD-(D/E)XK endonuclease [Hydrotalea sp. AMD]RWZ87176.1 MAG: hypothetical protein EO766_11595 [Hydrotalea sp. AMD]
MNEFDKLNLSVNKKQGNLGVARAIYEYTKMGYTVLVPLSDSDKYDLVIDDGVMLKRVQVKTSRCKAKSYKSYTKTGYQVNLSTKGGNSTINTIRCREKSDYDILFVLLETGDCWSIPTEALGEAKHSIIVGATGPNAKYTEYKICKGYALTLES